MRPLQHPETEAITLTGVLNALCDPARLQIVRSLQNGKERTCGEMGQLTKSTMSHHFRVLREAGITRTRLEGTRRISTLREKDLNARFPGLLKAVLSAREPL
ncbi:MAG: helix-turn-helix domain-containing protein [Thaumarchaeota archaeon]|nr:helix-turn-helix domain-containing protein [Nitrososphaerota archaeon]